ncbi:nuclear receptor subfamily 2 group F member 6-like isoform X2 [Apostichopus japonicus]
MDDLVTHDRGRSPRNPTPTLTALLMDSNYPGSEDVELSLMEIDNDHMNNNDYQFELHHTLLHGGSSQPIPQSTMSPPSAAVQVNYHSTSVNNQHKPHERNTSRQKRCSCACSESVTLVQEGNGRTDNLLAEWLTRSARMVRKYPVLGSIDTEDMRTLLYSSWKELVILYMAQNNFSFEVHPAVNQNIVCPHIDKPRKRRTIARMESHVPSTTHVDQLKFIIGKLEQMNIDSKEFALLRLLMLLNTDLRDLKNSNAVVKASEQIHMLLMEYETVCYPSNPLRLSHMLLHLPGVRGFPIMAFEQLFYRHLVGNTTVKSVLKELLET